MSNSLGANHIPASKTNIAISGPENSIAAHLLRLMGPFCKGSYEYSDRMINEGSTQSPMTLQIRVET